MDRTPEAPRRSRADRRRRLVAAALLAAGLSGCSQFRDPRTEFGTLRVAERGDEHARVELEVLVTNPNAEAIGLRELRYTFAMAGRTYAARRSVSATVGAGATSRFVVPAIVASSVLDGADAADDWRLDGTLLYITPGEIAEILLDAGVRRPKVRIRARGPWPAPAAPAPAASPAAADPGA